MSANLHNDYVRLCPTCGDENAPSVMRCACGALLSGVDLMARVALETAAPILPAESTSTATLPAADGPLCPHVDCGQPNPPGSTRCLYCDRPLDSNDEGLSGPAPGVPSLITLPAALRHAFRIERALPTAGAEAELLVVTPLAGGPPRIAKIYRHGIHPDREVQARIAAIDPKHRVEVLESGLSDGFAYELMEFCQPGSLRDLLKSGAPTPARLQEIIGELAAAIDGVHQAGLIHRDLKPENILIRRLEPLDLVLTDFGIASLQNATLHFTGVARTLAYGAPETLSGVIDGKADWWSLGMILLEAALGTHPFAGLSDAVILHRLTTRSLDLAAVNDPKLRKLLGGLLLRDPKKRWGAREIARWLANDPSLATPVSEDAGLAARRPYQIGDEACTTPEQLAVALARHWRQALSDLDNGLLMNWFRTELKDQNQVRFLIDLNLDRTLHVDVRLLRLIIDLAPGIPPVWRGDSLGLRDILMRADRALKNDAEAAHWLDALYEHRVLEAYAAGGNALVGDIVKRWHGALAQFNAAWTLAIEHIKAAARPGPGAPLRFDDAMYGPSAPLRPSPRQLHARLLALAYDEGWAARLRTYLSAEIPRLAIHCPWLLAIGDVRDLPAASLLALETLLPEARKQAKRAAEQEKLSEEEAEASTRRLQAEATMAINALEQAATPLFLGEQACAELRTALEAFSILAARIRALGRSDATYLNLRNRIARVEPIASRMSRAVEGLIERQAENRGWFSRQTLGFFAMLVFFVPLITQQEWLPLPLLLAGGALSAWRLLPNHFTRREIRALAARLRRA